MQPIVHSCVYHLLSMLVSKRFYTALVQRPSPVTPPEILNNPKHYPFFQSCLGSIDGSHFHAWVSEDLMARHRNRKGGITQNVLAACDFNMLFIYILSGWEGSASDSHIYERAREQDLAIPDGWYYLADAGFPMCSALLVPYRGKRYHLKEWARGNQAYVFTIVLASSTHTI